MKSNQSERTNGAVQYITDLMNDPRCVGYHWFEYVDEPVEGRFDGENCNFGVVNINDDAYVTLTDALTTVNANAADIHGARYSTKAKCFALSCPLNCNGNGCCKGSTCECFSGYSGAGCATEHGTFSETFSNGFNSSIWQVATWSGGSFLFVNQNVLISPNNMTLVFNGNGSGWYSGQIITKDKYGTGWYNMTARAPCTSHSWLSMHVYSSLGGARFAVFANSIDMVSNNGDSQASWWGYNRNGLCDDLHDYAIHITKTSVDFYIDNGLLWNVTDVSKITAVRM